MGKYLNAGQTCIAPDYVFVKKRAFRGFCKPLKTLHKKNIIILTAAEDAATTAVLSTNVTLTG